MNSRTPQWLLSVVLTVLVTSAPDAYAGETLFEGEAIQLRLGGYVSEFAAVQHIPYDTGGLVPAETGRAAGVLRLEWDATVADVLSITVHNRLFHDIDTHSFRLGNQFGLGASTAPERTLDTRTELVEGPGLLVEHDLDRAVASIFTDHGDIYVGRQAITWGNSNLFTTGDIWTRFSPFELDTSQKRGVDAVRFLGYAGGVELDVIIEWTDLESLGAGARAAWTIDRTDSWGALAWRKDELLGLMGLGVDLEVVRAHGEVSLPFDPDESRLELPRATLGLDYLAPAFSIVVEYHYNGPGTKSGEYIEQATSPDVADGRRYLLGRHYGGVAAAWMPNETYTLSLATFANLVDPSTLITPTATLTLSQNVDVTAGAYIGVGARPTLLPDPRIDSEFGAVGTVGFLQLTGYY